MKGFFGVSEHSDQDIRDLSTWECPEEPGLQSELLLANSRRFKTSVPFSKKLLLESLLYLLAFDRVVVWYRPKDI
jgi:hypothetical protein